MEEYIGKICPFCKTEIKEGDAVKVCPECGIPHHEACWEENKGCTTEGCSEQYHEEPQTDPADACEEREAPSGEEQEELCPPCGTPESDEKKLVCSSCGAELKEEQMFCPKCGTPVGAAKKRVCGKCGFELQEEQEFCPRCGQKADLSIDRNVHDAISQFNAGIEDKKKTARKKPLLIAIVAAAVALIAILAAVLIPKMIKSTKDYLAAGDYEKAYSKAGSENEKTDVCKENTVAFCSASCVTRLKDSKSFELRDAWYDLEEEYVVLEVAANNSYGNTVINYWLYYFSDNDKEWSLWEAYSDFERETVYSWDTSEEEMDKLFHNVGIAWVKDTMVSSNKLSADAVERINALFRDDKLHDIKLLDEAIPKGDD